MSRSRNRLVIIVATVALALTSSAFTAVAATDSGKEIFAGSCCRY